MILTLTMSESDLKVHLFCYWKWLLENASGIGSHTFYRFFSNRDQVIILPSLTHDIINPYREFWIREKNPKSSLVTSPLRLTKWKLYMQIECRSGYTMVQISNGICQYERKYAVLNKNICHFLGPWPSVFSGKKIQSTETYTNLLNAALWIFFPQNTLGDGPAFWIFFQDSRIRVKGSRSASSH